MHGKQIVVTGATSGIGLAAAEALARLGASVAVVGRNEARTREVQVRVAEVARHGASITSHIADLSSQKDVRRLAAEVLERYARLDALVNNAGVMSTERRLTEDSRELTWAVNHLAPFLLTTLLCGRLEKSAPARVVTTSGIGHYLARIPFDDLDAGRSYSGMRRYCETKLANVLFTAELARRLEGTGVVANCFHPGVVASGFYRAAGGLAYLSMLPLMPFLRSPEKGAETLVWLASAPEAAQTSGGYFVDKRPRTPSAEARDPAIARRLWQASEAQVGRSA